MTHEDILIANSKMNQMKLHVDSLSSNLISLFWHYCIYTEANILVVWLFWYLSGHIN